MKKITFVLLSFIPLYAMSQDFSKIDTLLKNYTGKNPGAALAVIQNGKLLFNRCYGLANLEEQLPVTEKSNFRLASVSKQFTAAAILQLIRQHKIEFETRLSDCFNDLPAYAEEITIRQMLQHTSGILDYDDVIDESNASAQLSDADVLKACTRFKNTYFPPGTQYRYSNTAYVLLGLILEKYSGMSYPDYMKKFIFRPLKMKSSVAYLKGINEIGHRAYGYGKQQKNWIRKDQSSTSATLGDGGIYSNLIDMAKWDAALYTDKILPLAVWQDAFSRQSLNNGNKIDYGYGWRLKESQQGEAVVYHTGSTTSFRNIFYRIPSKKISLILLTNRNTPDEPDMVGFAEQILMAIK